MKLEVLLYIIALSGALAAAYRWIFRPLWLGGRRIHHFLESWEGSPARPGVAARPGVMERLSGLEDKATQTEKHVGNGNRPFLRQLVVETHDAVAKLENRTTNLEELVKKLPPEDKSE